MNSLEKTRQLCKKYNIKPARSRGQNFLIEEDVYNKIIKAADLHVEDTVLEIGPGLGFLTRKLAEKVKQLMSVELDDLLFGILKNNLKKERVKNIKMINDNILDLDFGTLGLPHDYKVVANLPYNITSVFLRKFLSNIELRPRLMVLMLQKEVAERITAKVGKMSLLAVSVQFYSEPEIIEPVSRNAFWPQPEVDSAIVKLKIKGIGEKGKNIEDKQFFRLVKIGFSARRKMLKNNLVNGFKISQKEAEEILKKAGFNEKARAQDLSVEDWVKLYGFFSDIML